MPAELATTLTATEADRLEQAEGFVRGYCRWHIAPTRTETVTVRAASRSTLLLKSLHVTDVVSVTVDDDLVADTDYEWSEAGVLTRLSGYWPSGAVQVQFTHGYADVPPEVAGIVQAVAQRAMDNPGSQVSPQDGPFRDSHSQSGSNQAPALHLLDAEKATLDRYRLPNRS